MRKSPPTASSIDAITTIYGSACIAIVMIEMIGTIKKVRRNMKSPCLTPRLRGESFLTLETVAGTPGLMPPVISSSRVPDSRKPQPEQKLVSVETLSWPHLGQYIYLDQCSSFSSNLVVLSVTLVG